MSPLVQPSGPPNTVQPNAWVNAEDPQSFVELEMVEGATQIFPYASLIAYIFIPPPPKTWINFHHQQIMSSFILLINDDSKTIPCLPKLFFLIVQPMLPNLGLGHRLVLSDAVRSAENHTAPRSSTITTTTWNLKECYINVTIILRTSQNKLMKIRLDHPSLSLSVLRDFVWGCAWCWTVWRWFQYSANLPGFQDQNVLQRYLLNLL